MKMEMLYIFVKKNYLTIRDMEVLNVIGKVSLKTKMCIR